MDFEQALREQSERHHAAIGDIAKVLAKFEIKQTQIYDLIAGDPMAEKPGHANRIRSLEEWRKEISQWSLRKWGGERATKLIDHGAAALLIYLVIMAAKGAVLDLMDQTMQINYQRDRVALNQEQNR